MATVKDAHQLLQLLQLTQASVHQIIEEWAKSPPKEEAVSGTLPSRALFQARRTLIAATGKFAELVSGPSDRLLEVSSQYNEARALHIATAMRIPDLLAKGDDKGVTIEDVSAEVGIESRKLGDLPNFHCSKLYLGVLD